MEIEVAWVPSFRVASCETVCARCASCVYKFLKRIKKEDLATKREPCRLKQVYSTRVSIKWSFYCWKQLSITSQKRKPTLIRNDIEVNAEKSASNILLEPFLSLHISEPCRQEYFLKLLSSRNNLARWIPFASKSASLEFHIIWFTVWKIQDFSITHICVTAVFVMNFVNLVTFSLPKVPKCLKKSRFRASKCVKLADFPLM